MGYVYTDRLALSTPDKGECNWWYDWFRNTNIMEAVNAQDNSANCVIDGCELAVGAGVSVDITSGKISVAGTTYTVPSGNIPLTAKTTEREQYNLIYINDTGTLVVYPSTNIPTGDFVLIGVVDCDAVAAIRIGDLRRKVAQIININILPSGGQKNDVVHFDGSLWLYDPAESATDNVGTVVFGWVRQYVGAVYATWFSKLVVGGDWQPAIQAAIDIVFDTGGVVWIPEGVYIVESSVVVPQAVTLVGAGNGYNRLYVDETGLANGFQVYGSVLKLATGANTDVVVVTYVPRSGESSIDAPDKVRHQGGLVNLTIHGNKSINGDPTDTTNNTVGNGISIQGCSNVLLDDILVVRCPEDGVVISSKDYGEGSISCNNMLWGKVQSLLNQGSGFNLTGGDQQFGTMTAGRNHGHGIISNAGRSQIAKAFCWNNEESGIKISSARDVSIVSCHCYDNEQNGLHVLNTPNVTVSGGMFMNNGRDGLGGTNACGVKLDSGVDNFIIGDSALYEDSAGTQAYGLHSSDSSNTMTIGDINAYGNITANFSLLNYNNVQVHTDLSENLPKHPGFVAQGGIDLSGFSVADVKYFSGGSDGAATADAGVVTVSKTFSAYTTTVDRAVSVIVASNAPEYAIIYIRNGITTNTLTLTHSNGSIRCPNGQNVVLGSYEAVMLRAVNSTNTIWQVYGAAV